MAVAAREKAAAMEMTTAVVRKEVTAMAMAAMAMAAMAMVIAAPGAAMAAAKTAEPPA